MKVGRQKLLRISKATGDYEHIDIVWNLKESGNIYEQGLNKNAKVEVKVIPPSTTGETVWNLAVMVVPVLIIVVFFMFMMRQAQGQNNQAMGFGKSKAS